MNTILPPTISDSDLRIQLPLTIIGAVGILAILLPFAFGDSPLAAALHKDMWRLAWPFFIPVLITVASARWLIFGKHSRSESVIAYLVSAAMFCVTFSIYVTMPGWPPDLKTWIGFACPIVTLVFGIFTLLRGRLNAMLNPYGAMMSMQLAYLANCLLCLSSFFGAWQIGAYCSLLTAIAYLIQITLLWNHDEVHGSVPVH